MINKSVYNLELNKFLTKEQLDFWFSLSRQKFLQNIDTFYYSVKLSLDTQNELKQYESLISYLESYIDKEISFYEYPLNEINSAMVLTNGYFASYSFHIKIYDDFDFFILKQPDKNTSEILVQIRSYPLWLYGAHESMINSLKYVNLLLDYFSIEIECTKVNRLDFCFHTNYFESPERFFNIDNISDTVVTKIKDIIFHYELSGERGYQVDYVKIGNLKSRNYIFRAYNKTKEVIEQGYKGWFLKIWLLHKLINHYDFYCLEKCYLKRDYFYLDFARLEFYKENIMPFKTDSELLETINNLLDGTLNWTYDKLHNFVDALLPPVTIILNNEFQTMRKFYFCGRSRYIEFKNIKARSGYNKELLIMLDNRILIIDYLTSSCIRFVKEGSSRKSRADYSYYWKKLRNSRVVDFQKNKHNLKLVRQYENHINKQVAFNTMLSKLALFNVYNSRIKTDLIDDVMDAISLLNDNDVRNNEYFSLKHLKLKQLSNKIDTPAETHFKNEFSLINNFTGEIMERKQYDF